MDNYIQGPHIITYRVHTSNGFSYQESMTVGCHVGYDEAYRYVCDQWGYGGDTDVEILCIEPTPAAIRDHEIEQERKREEQEREARRRME